MIRSGFGWRWKWPRGKTIDNGLVRTLTQAEWLEQKKRLDAGWGLSAVDVG